MRIGLRVFYSAGWLGGVNYVLGIARMLRELPPAQRPFLALLTSTPEAERIAQENRSLADAIAPFNTADQLSLDFVYPATQLAEAPLGTPWAGWIPDWQCQHFPEMFAESERRRRRIQFGLLAEQSAVCVFSSRQAIDDTRELFPGTSTRLRALHFPANLPWSAFDAEAAGASELRDLRKPYVVVCNQFWRHKNHIVILRALERSNVRRLHVVMTGELDDTRWPDYAKELLRQLESPSVASRVTVTGRVSRAVQIALMRNAVGIVQPSLFEGWSSFVEEARALGLPALLSDIPVHREQNPPGAKYFDPHDPEQLAGLLDAWDDELPVHRPIDACRQDHQQRLVSAARDFAGIAEETSVAWEPDRNDPKAITLSCLSQLRTSLSGQLIDQEDLDRFCAGVRQLFRDHPEHLAELETLSANGDPDQHALVSKQIVAATLAKMSSDNVERYRGRLLGLSRTGPVSETERVNRWVQLRRLFRRGF